jgi:hypothetical protein
MCSYCNYEFVLAKVCCDFWECSSYFVVCGFSRTIRATNISLLFLKILVVCE